MILKILKLKKKDTESDASVDANKKQKDCKSLDTCTGIKFKQKHKYQTNITFWELFRGFFYSFNMNCSSKIHKKREEKLIILTQENFGLKNIKTIKPTISGAFIEAF